MYTPVNPQFYYIKVGFKWVEIIGACFRDGTFSGISDKMFLDGLCLTLLLPMDVYTVNLQTMLTRNCISAID